MSRRRNCPRCGLQQYGVSHCNTGTSAHDIDDQQIADKYKQIITDQLPKDGEEYEQDDEDDDGVDKNQEEDLLNQKLNQQR